MKSKSREPKPLHRRDRRIFAGMRSSPTRWILLAAIAVHVITAWFSTGFHSADEHYQVIAFAEAKLGHQPVSGLPWEYEAQIRSALLPAIGWVVFKAAHAIGISDPFILSFLLRLLTAALAVIAVAGFIRAVRPLVPPKLWTTFLILSWFLWFLPFLHVRFTGETWSGLLFLLGLATLLSPEERRARYFRTGLLFGLAFLCRPPVLMMAVGVGAWLFLVQRERPHHLLAWIAGICAMAIMGIAVDNWFYGTSTFTAWNYLRLGITGSPDHPFTAFAWWYYPAWVVKYAIPPIGLAILAAFATLLVLRPKSLLVWVIFPFLALHLALPHKDLRFLYPLVDLVPLLIVLAWGIAQEWRMAQAVTPRTLKVIVGLMAIINLGALAVIMISPAGTGRTRLAKAVQNRYVDGPVRLNYIADESTVWDIRIPRFYLPASATDTLITEPCNPLQREHGAMQLLVSDGPIPQCDPASDRHWQEVERALPWWKASVLKAYEMEDVRAVWVLYESKPGAAARLPSSP